MRLGCGNRIQWQYKRYIRIQMKKCKNSDGKTDEKCLSDGNRRYRLVVQDIALSRRPPTKISRFKIQQKSSIIGDFFIIPFLKIRQKLKVCDQYAIRIRIIIESAKKQDLQWRTVGVQVRRGNISRWFWCWSAQEVYRW